MTTDQIAVFAIIAGALVLFIWGRIRHDLVALLALCAVALSDLTPDSKDLFAGFGHPAVFTVLAVLIVSHGLNKCGAGVIIARAMSPYFGNQLVHIAGLTAVVTVLSAFMNNIGALALMTPIALATAEERGRNPGLLLMPLAFGSLLGGMATAIGTPPNIIISGFRADALGEPYRMFDFASAGAAAALVGVVFLALVGWRLLPRQKPGARNRRELFSVDGYLIEMRVPADSPLAGLRLRDSDMLNMIGVTPLSVLRADRGRLPAVGYRIMREDDVMSLRVDPKQIPDLIKRFKLELVREDRDGAVSLQDVDWRDAAVVEVVLRHDSPLVGRTARVVNRRFHTQFSMLAIARAGERLTTRLREIKLAPGDVVLVQGDGEAIQELMNPLGMMPLAERGLAVTPPPNAGLAMLTFALAVGAASMGFMDIGVAFVMTILLYVAFGVLSPRELYEEVDWPVIILLGGMFPVGAAMSHTGADRLAAQWLLAGMEGAPIWALLMGLIFATSIVSNVINNAATAVLAGPIALRMAEAVGEGPDPFLMAAAVGASCAFLTPIGHQSNLLVWGPGGYRFTDFTRMGAPLTVLVILIATPLILWRWG